MGGLSSSVPTFQGSTTEESDFVHSRTTALRGTVAASLLAGRNNDAPAALSARWSRRVVGLVADFCDVPTVAALSATCRDSMRAVHDTRPVPLPAMSAVDAAWTATMPLWSPHSISAPECDPELKSLPAYFNAVSEMATDTANMNARYGGGWMSIELLHPVVAAFVENLWIQEQCNRGRSGDNDGEESVREWRGTSDILLRGYGGVQAVSLACAAPRREETALSAALRSQRRDLCSWSVFAQEIRRTIWQNNIPTWPDESPGSLAGKPVDPSTFFHDLFTSDQIKNGSLHAPVIGARVSSDIDYGVGCLWRREVPAHATDALPVEWCFVAFEGLYD